MNWHKQPMKSLKSSVLWLRWSWMKCNSFFSTLQLGLSLGQLGFMVLGLQTTLELGGAHLVLVAKKYIPNPKLLDSCCLMTDEVLARPGPPLQSKSYHWSYGSYWSNLWLPYVTCFRYSYAGNPETLVHTKHSPLKQKWFSGGFTDIWNYFLGMHIISVRGVWKSSTTSSSAGKLTPSLQVASPSSRFIQVLVHTDDHKQ